MRRRYRIGLLLLLAAAVLATRPWRFLAPAADVQTAPLRQGALELEWSATGYVEAKTAHLAAPQTGRLTAVLVREGDRVRAGQVLARLASPAEEAARDAQRAAREAARAAADAAEASALDARRTLPERIARLRAERDAAQARAHQAQIALQRARATASLRVDAARAEAEAARAQLADLEAGARAEEIAQADADREAADAAAARARTEAQRQEALLREGAVPQQAVDAARETLARTEAARLRAQAVLDLLRRGPRAEQAAAARARLRAAQVQVMAAVAERSQVQEAARRAAETSAARRAADAAWREAIAERQTEARRSDAQAARARIAQSDAALRQADATLAERTLVAPFDGTIGRRFLDPGDLAHPAQSALTLLAAEAAWVVAEVDEQDLAPVRPGQRVVLSAAGYAGRSFAGIVERIGAEAIPQTDVRTGARIVRVRISLAPTPPTERARLRPGMQVHVEGRATVVPEALLAPNDAVLTDARGSFVYAIQDGRARRLAVQPGYVGVQETELRAGPAAGTAVVIAGKEGLADGARVRVQRRP